MDEEQKKLNQQFVAHLMPFVGKTKELEEEFHNFSLSFENVSKTKFTWKQAGWYIHEYIKEIELQDFLLKKAEKTPWISETEKKWVIEYILQLQKEKGYKKEHLVKAFLLFMSIPYAEYYQDGHGTLNNYIYEHKMHFKDILKQSGTDSSFTSWQIPIPHLKVLIPEKNMRSKFIKDLTSKEAVQTVGRILLERIWLHHQLDTIFSQYNHSSTINANVSALQLFINSMKLISYDIIIHFDNLSLTKLEENFETYIQNILQIDSSDLPYSDVFLSLDEKKILRETFHKFMTGFLSKKNDKEFKIIIYNNWPSLEINWTLLKNKGDGKYAFQRALEYMMRFYNFENLNILELITAVKTDEERLKLLYKECHDNFSFSLNFRKITIPPSTNREILDNFWLKDILLRKILNTSAQGENDLRNNIIKTIDISWKFDKNIKKYISENSPDKRIIVKNIFEESDWIIAFFRREFFQNPAFVNGYVNSWISAFWWLLQEDTQ